MPEDRMPRKGEKVVLTGGGGIANEFHIAKFIELIRPATGGDSLDEAAQVRLQVRMHGTKTKIFTPYIWSWQIAGIKKSSPLASLPLGTYLETENVIRDASQMGLFGTIYDAPIVLKFEQGEWHRVRADPRRE